METLTPEILGTVVWGIISSGVVGHIVREHLKLRQEEDTTSFALLSFSSTRKTHQTPMAIPGRGYSFSAKTEMGTIQPSMINRKWDYWRTEWKELPKISELR